MQLSAFFTFYRNHNTLGAISQEPYRWASVIEASRTAMNIRYSLLPYVYTLFYNAHTTGSTVHRAMVWEFPSEPTLASADRQFMLGPSLLITPVLEPLADTVNGVFPGSSSGTIWYDWYNQTAITNPAAKASENVTIYAPLGHIPVYVRGGSVLPMQPLQDALTVRDTQTHDWTLLVALDGKGEASGSLYLDDGESVFQDATLDVCLTVSNDCLCATPTGSFKNANPLASVTVMGIESAPNGVRLNGAAVQSFAYSSSTKVLEVNELDSATSDGAWTKEWRLCWS
jgi:alpha-glucosidase